MNGSLTTDALVLRRSEWRDYDRMVTLFTPEFGRVDAVAQMLGGGETARAHARAMIER